MSFWRFLSSLIGRAICSAPFFWASWFFLKDVSADAKYMPEIMAGLVCGIIGGAIIAPLFASLIAESSGSLYYSGERFSERQPRYSAAQGLRMKGLSQEAMDAYQKIADDNSGDIKPYIEMMNIAVMDMDDPKLADKILKRGLWAARTKNDKATLKEMNEAIKSRQAVRSATAQPLAYKKQENNINRRIPRRRLV